MTWTLHHADVRVALARARIASDAPLVAATLALPVPINLPLEGFA